MKKRKIRNSYDSIGEHVVVITGASSGIGKQVALELVPYKAKLALIARRKEKLEETKNKLIEHGIDVISFVGDVREEEDRNKFIASIMAKYGRIDILFNNAGLGKNTSFLNQASDEIAELVNTNILALMQLTHSVVSQMKRQGCGQIINMSSAIAFLPTSPFAVYTATKMAVKMFSDSIRTELKEYGITVSTVYPALHDTHFCDVANISAQSFKTYDKISLAKRIVKLMSQPKNDVIFPWIYVPIVWLVRNFTWIKKIMTKIISKKLTRGRLNPKKDERNITKKPFSEVV